MTTPREIIVMVLRRMKRSGESHEMAARWIMEDLHKVGFEVKKSNWKSMKDAPRDGTPFLGSIFGEYYAIFEYDVNNPKGNQWRVQGMNAWFSTDSIYGWTGDIPEHPKQRIEG